MRNKVIDFARSLGLGIAETQDAVDITFPARPNFDLKITVPYSVNEWFIYLRKESEAKDMFTDCVDHYNLNSGDKTDLDEEMQDSIISTIEALNNAEVRIGKSAGVNFLKWEFFTTDILEVLTESGWVDHHKLMM